MHKILIGTNWKMHKTIAESKEYTTKLKEFMRDYSSNIEVFIIPPYTSLIPVQEIVKDSSILLGAQNMHWQDEGPYTGEISPVQLKEIGIEIVELGHSERRTHFNETDETLHKKVKAALRHSLTPLICIGETSEEKELGLTKQIITKQIKTILQKIEVTEPIWVAYEPRWAIGIEGKSADPDYIQDIHGYIRELLEEVLGKVGQSTPILYGGSVNNQNAIDYLRCEHVNGLFIGRAAWEIDSFQDILLQVKEFVEQEKKVRL